MALSVGVADRPAFANPTGPTVVNGQVTINQAGNLLSITNSPNSIINWQAFSIGAREITRFSQQSAASAVLNRVVGTGGTIDPSVILGTLQSNGRVFLLNPSGIVFGPGSQIDVAGLVASSLNLSNADFLGGRLKFSEVPGAGAVVNQGAINAASGGQVYLVGPAVTNSGIITSPKGEVILAAGKSVELVNPGTPNLRVEITAPDNEARNLGSIVADAGRIGIYAGLINQSGTIRADNAVATEDGRIILKATKSVDLAAGSVTTANGAQGGRIEINAGDTSLAAGTIEAKGATGQGGTVHLLGDKVGVYGNARVDVSGQTGGGTVLAGGEYQGGAGITAVEGASLRNATSTFFGSDATIAADAMAAGDGGKVIVWSDNTTRSYGAISARGGAAAGNGGLVETSGKLNLDVTRGPDLRAPNGSGGTWLIDPNNLEVVSGTEATANAGQPFFSTLGGSSRIGADLINTQLNFGSSVVLTTANQGTADSGQPGNITVSAPILKTAATMFDQAGTAVGPVIGPTSLTLQAHNSIVINPGGSIASTGDPLNVTLQANIFNPGTGTGGVTVNDAILTNGGALSITGRGAINLNAPLNTVKTIGTGVANGGVFISSSADAVNVSAAVASSSSFTARGMTGVAINAPVTAPNNAPIEVSSSAGPVSVGAAMTGGAFLADGFTGVTIGAPTSANASSSPQACNFSFASVCLAGHAGAITINAPVTGTGGGYLIADSMNIQAALNAGSAGIVAVPFTNARPMNLGSEDAGSLSLTQAELSNLITSGPKTFGSSTTGAITVSQPVSVGSSSVTVSSGASLTVISGASLATAVPLGLSAPIMNLNGPVSGQSVILTTSNLTLAPAATVASGGNIDVVPGAFVPVNIGVATHGAGSLDLTSGELNQFVTGPGGTLRVGGTNSGALTVRAPIAPTGTSILRLVSGSGGISQDMTPTPATITVPKLELQTSGTVSLPAQNNVQTLGANTSGSSFTFTNTPGQLLTIGNFGSASTSIGGNATLTTDGFNVASPSTFGIMTVMPHSNTVRLDLGGADGSGVLGISQADLDNIFGNTLKLKADRADISTPLTFNTNTLAIAPLTSGLALHIETAKSGSPIPGVTPLEFVPAELAGVSGPGRSLALGDAQTGLVTVNAPVNLTNVGTLTLQSGTAGLLTVAAGNPVTAPNVVLFADDMDIGATVTATTGSLTIAPSTAGTQIDLGGITPPLTGTPGAMNLSTTELGLLAAPNGTLTLGSSIAGDVFNTTNLTFSIGQIGNLSLVSGSKATVGTDGVAPVSAPGTISISAPTVEVFGPLTSASAGNINVAANTLDVGSPVTTTSGDINVSPLTFRSIGLIDNAGTPVAGELTVSQFMLDNFSPSTGVVRIGNANGLFTTGNITVRGPINNFGSASFNTLHLVSNSGAVSETTGSTLALPNLAVQSSSGITLDQGNQVQNVSLRSNFGNVSFRQSGSLALNIATVAGQSGIQTNSGTVSIAADKLNINTSISSPGSAGSVVITPNTSSLGLDIVATKAGPNLELTPTEISRVATNNLTLTAASITVGSAITVPLNIDLVADKMTLNADVNASKIAARQLNQFGTLTPIDLGGNDGTFTPVLGLNSTDISHMKAATLAIGDSATPSITVTAPINFTASSGATLTTAATGPITVNAGGSLSNTGNLVLTADVFNIGGSVSGANVTLDTVSNNRIVNIGSLAGGNFALDQSALNFITTPGTLTVSANTIDVTSPVTLANAGNLTLRANSMNVTGSVTMNGAGSSVNVAPRSFNTMRLGTNTGTGLLLSDAEIDGFIVPNGVLRLGDTSQTSQVSIEGPISVTNAGALSLTASSGITQTTGSTITTANLRLQTFGSATLTQDNAVGTLAGSASGNFNFTTAGVLTVGPSVDGVAGLSGGTLMLRSDDIALTGPGTITNGTATLAPRTAGAAINLGASPGSVYGVDAGELAQITSTTLAFGIPTGTNPSAPNPNPSGAVVVSAPMQRNGTSQRLFIETGDTQTVDVNAALSAGSNIRIDAGTINVSQPITSSTGSITLTARAPTTLNVNAPLTAGTDVILNSDVVNIFASITANPTSGTVTIAPVKTAVPVSLGVESSGVLSLTQAELALISAPNLTLGSSSAGPMTIAAPISLGVNSLSLFSGSSITQNPSAPIILTLVNANGQRIGNLNVQSFGTGNGNAGISMTAANEIPGTITFGTRGTNNDFIFVNTLPTRLQSLNNQGVTGAIRFASGAFVPPPPVIGEAPLDFNAQLLAALNELANINDILDSESDLKKAEEERKKSTECR